MSNELWRWADPNGQQRRVRLDELRASLASGLIAPNTPVWKPGWAAWQPAQEVPELSTSAVAAANGVVPNIPPPPLAVVAVQHAWEARAAESFRPPPVVRAGEAPEPPPPPSYVPQATHAPSVPPAVHPSMATPGLAGFTPGPGSSMKTAIGLPPPPEIVALAAARAAQRDGARPAVDPMIEELSGSVLLDESGGPNGHFPAPTDPIHHDPNDPIGTPFPGADESLQLPVRSPLKSLVRDIGEIRAGRPPQNKRLLIVAGVIAGSVVILFLAVVISAISSLTSSKTSTTPVASASSTSAASGSPATASASAPPTVSATPSAVVSAPPKEDPKPAPSAADCTIAGDAKSLGWRAVIASGIEAAPAAGGIALGFATSAKDGIALSVDPASLASASNAKTRAGAGDVRRVTPLLLQGKLAAVADVDRRGDKLAGRRTVATSPPIDIGVTDGALSWAPHGRDSWAKLFTLEGDVIAQPVEALRAIPLTSEKGIAVAFRRGNAIWVGVAKGEGALKDAGFQSIAGLGQVGAPALTTSGDNIVVAWADRGSAAESWQVRWTKLTVGGSPQAPVTLPLPEGGLGIQAMSPSVAGLGGGRFLVAWTEGAVSNHQVRAITMTADGAASGAALAVSPQGLNAGQPSVAVGADGRGVVAFLAGKAKGYEVYVSPVTCAAH